jgi:hypothetical protein
MDTTISIKTIEATDAFKNLSKVQQSFCLKRANRLILTNALIVNRNTGIIPSNISGYNLFVLQEIILGESVKSQEPDLSLKARRPCFSVPLSNFIEKPEGNKLENLEVVNKETKSE